MADVQRIKLRRNEHVQNRILALKEVGLSLAEIAQLLNEPISLEEMRGMFRLKEAEVRQQLEGAQARLALVANRLKQI